MKTYSVLKSFEWPPRPRKSGAAFYGYARGSTQTFPEWPPAARESIAARYIADGYIAEVSTAVANPGIPDPEIVPPAKQRLPASLRLR